MRFFKTSQALSLKAIELFKILPAYLITFLKNLSGLGRPS